MVAPVVSSTSPANNATDVNITSRITVTFSTAINSSSVTMGTFTVFRYDTLQEVEGSFTVSGAVVTFLPSRALYEDKVYSVALVGSADSNPAGAIQSTDDDYMVDSYAFSFRTQVEQYATLEKVEQRADVTHDGPVRVEDITAAGGLELISVDPPGFSTDLDTSLDRVAFKFSGSVDASSVSANSSIYMETYPVLGIEEYYADATGGFRPELYSCASEEFKESGFQQPTGEFSVDGDMIYWAKVTGEPDFNYNTEVLFRITQGVKDVNGHFLISEVRSTMTTKYFPKFMSSHIMRIECGPMVSDQFDDVLNRHLHKNSIEAWEEASYGFDMYTPYPAVRRWVRSKSVLDMFNMVSARAQAMAGQTKWLRDLRIEYPNTPQPRINYGIMERANRELEKLTPELRSYRRQSLPLVAIKGGMSGDEDRARRSRRWSIETEVGSTFFDMTTAMLPASNLVGMRDTKLGLAHDEHDHIDYRQSTFYHGAGPNGVGLFVCPTVPTA